MEGVGQSYLRVHIDVICEVSSVTRSTECTVEEVEGKRKITSNFIIVSYNS